MVPTPDARPNDPFAAPLSPLVLPSRSSSVDRAHGAPSPSLLPPTLPCPLHEPRGRAGVSGGASTSTSTRSTSTSTSVRSLSPHPVAPPLRKSSTSSFSKLSDFHLDSPVSEDEPAPTDAPAGTGVRHVDLSVDAGEWRHPVFKQKVLAILRRLRIAAWAHPSLTPSAIHLQKVSGALTNAVFFVSFNPAPRPTSPSVSPLLTPTMPALDPAHPPPLDAAAFPPTLLLRVYGPSSDALVSRAEELRVLHVLSTVYGLGPRVFGTFANGRVEQFFPSRALTAPELREPHVARSIARRMRELHAVDLAMLGYDRPQPAVWKSVDAWSAIAQDTLTTLGAVGGRWEVWVETFGLHRLAQEVHAYKRWVEERGDKDKRIVFAHNDTQYGNLLRLDVELPKGHPEHHRYIVIDFEYAAPNPRGYDIANHFHEWRANYHHPTLAHSLQPHFAYPTRAERDDWYRAYLSVEMDARNGEELVGRRRDVAQARVDALEAEVRMWSPASSLCWALWGIVQAQEQIDGLVDPKPGYEPDFDYLSYAMERLQMFRKEAGELGVPLPMPA
ncbi:hypothetical protein Q5752_006315 [Cryptotrichosporon argae]